MFVKKVLTLIVLLISFQNSTAQLNISILGKTEACLGIYNYRLSECVSPSVASNISWIISKADGSSAAGLAQVSGTSMFCSTLNAAQVNFLSEGSYKLTCSITLAGNGPTNQIDFAINVANIGKPIINAIIGKGACVGDVTTYKAINFSTGQSPSEYTYNWEFTNPQTGSLMASGPNATVTYLQTGSGELSVTPSVPGCVGDKVWSGSVVYVYPYPVPVITSINGEQNGSNITRCGTDPIILKSSMENGNQTFQWKINGQLVGGSAGTQQNLAVNTPSTASVIVTNSLTCSTESAPVNVSWILRPEMYPIPIQTVCSDGTLNYTPTLLDPLPGTTFMWDGPNGRKSGSSIIETFGSNVSSSPILYNFTVYPFYNGCNGNILPMTVYLMPSPVLTSTLTPTSVCSGSTFNYAPSLNIGSSVSWTRASISGISEGASSGTNGISEVLTNTTTEPIDVTYVFSLTSTGNVCTNTQNVVVKVNPTSTLTSSLSPPAICSGSSINYVPTSSVSGTTFRWRRDAVSGINELPRSGSGSINEVLTNFTSTPINVTYVYSLSCSSDEQFVVVTVNPTPSLTTYSPPDIICSGRTFNYTPRTSVSGSTFSWVRPAVTGISEAPNSGTGNINEVLTNTTSSLINVTYVYSLSANGCPGSNQNVVVQVEPGPMATISSSGGPTFCIGGSVTLSSNSPIGNRWSTGATTQSINVAASGNYSLTVTNANGCSATSEPTTITVNPLPSATITPSGATTFCQGGSVTLTASSGSSYLWSTGATTQSITVGTAGNYTLTVTNANGCSATSAPTTITVNPLPSANITPSGATTFCQGGSVTLTASSGSSYLWSTGATTQSITVGTAGNYSVTVTNANGCSATSALTTITVNPLPSVSITPSGATTFCQGGSGTLTASVGSSYLWSTGATTQNITVAASGSYTVRVTDANGCSATSAATNVTVNPSPAAPTISTSGPTSFCQGGSLTLTSSAGSSYLWSNGATTQSITVSTSGNYTVTTSNGNGCTATSAATTVTVNPLPSATITPSGTTIFCQGGSVTLTANGGASYLWSTGATTQSIVVNTSGNYTVRVTNSNACFATSLATSIVVNPSSSATFSGPTSVCSGSTSTYTAPTGMSNYNWSVVNGTINSGSGTNSVSVSWQSSGSISLSYTSSAGCAMPTSTLNVSISLGGRITASPGTNICRNGYAFLTAPSGTSYAWSTGQSSQSITVYEPGVYSVFVTGVCTRNYSITIVRTGINCTNVRIAAIEPPPADSDGEPNVTEVTVFPNPATKLITVALPEKLKEEKPIYLYNMMGNTIIQSKIPQGKWKVQLDLENVPEGIYLVKVGYGDYGIVKKVMVMD